MPIHLAEAALHSENEIGSYVHTSLEFMHIQIIYNRLAAANYASASHRTSK